MFKGQSKLLMVKIIRKNAADDFSSNIDDGMLFSLLSPTATFDRAANLYGPIHFVIISFAIPSFLMPQRRVNSGFSSKEIILYN